MASTILRLPDVISRTKLSRSSIYSRMSVGAFPKQISLGNDARAVGWLEHEIDAWIDLQISNSRQGAAK
jgi:prophage regulatory protein